MVAALSSRGHWMAMSSKLKKLLIIFGAFALGIAALPFVLLAIKFAVLDPLIMNYEVVASMRDGRGKFIEVARVYPDVADHIVYNMYVYPAPDPGRRFSNFAPLVLTLDGLQSAPRLSFDGQCYNLIEKTLTNSMSPTVWTDSQTNERYCFYLGKEAG